MKKILIPIPSRDFDPTETGVPWKILSKAGVQLTFATPSGHSGHADERMVTGRGLGALAPLLAADKNGRDAYQEMVSSKEFRHPISWEEIDPSVFDGVILPGGHAKGMKKYLESPVLQDHIVDFFKRNKCVGAICHGVVLASRSQVTPSQSVLFGRKTTALLASQEIAAWLLTCTWLGDYYRTYPQTVEAEVRASLAFPTDFVKGPAPLLRDSKSNRNRGFAARDRNYLSARWPGDAHQFAFSFLDLLKNSND